MGRRADIGFDLSDDLPVLIGRQDDIEAVTRVVQRCRLVTLTGPPGIGKTRVALEVARRIHESNPSRAALVELAAISDPGLVAQTVAFGLGFESQPGRDPIDALVADLGPLTILVVLDNCEPLLDACAVLVDRVLADCGGVSVLATSQLPLGLDGEQVTELPPLSLPDAITTPERAVAESDAVALFCARAAAIRSDFRLTPQSLRAVIEICRRLDGIPLAIELAAARLTVMGATDVAERLEDRFGLLTKGDRRSPPRHQTLRAAIDWSYDLLSEPEAMLLRRLSVFAGGACLSAICEVTGGDGLESDNVDELLEALVSRSLVVPVAETSRSPARWRLLETIRAYAGERLEDAGEAAAVRRRHALWCASRAERLSGQQSAGDDWIDDLEVDHDNLRAALSWSVGGDVVVALRLAVALTMFWHARGYFGEGQSWLAAALRAAARGGSQEELAPALHCDALCGLASLATVRGDIDTAQAAAEQALGLARQANLAAQEARASNLFGHILLFTQEALRAKPELEKAVARARDLGDRGQLRSSLILLGRVRLYLGEIGEARAAFEECVTISKPNPPRALFCLALTAFAAGDDKLAQEQFEVAVLLLRQVRERYGVAVGLTHQAELARARGDKTTARALAQEGLEEARTMGAPYPEASCLCVLALLTWAEGDLPAAMRLGEQACQVVTKAHLGYGRVRCLDVRGVLKRAAGDFEGARDDFEEALSVATDNGDRLGRALSMRHLGGLLRALGAGDEAVAMVQGAIGIEADIGGAGLASAVEALAGIAVDEDRAELGATLYGAAEAIRNNDGPFRRPDEVAAYEADVGVLRTVLKGRELKSAWTQGARLSAEEAVALALGEEATMALREVAPEGPTIEQRWAQLTRRERRIAEMLRQGMSSVEIAAEFDRSTRTVHGHVGRMLSKLGLKSRNELMELDLSGVNEGTDARS
ncbi:MAG TPA: tetratricopeptide repeat protein [Acidimicrobiales bacterium]|nr:tetratricopeptide repeat protein [Acidimicrobiales bacterium]